MYRKCGKVSFRLFFLVCDLLHLPHNKPVTFPALLAPILTPGLRGLIMVECLTQGHNTLTITGSNPQELAQFPVTARSGGGVREADLRARHVITHNLCLYQASSRGGGCNLARFGSPEPGLEPTNFSL